MDFFTHVVVGIAVGRLIFKNPNHQKAFILGIMAPDFDVFIAWLPFLIPIPELVILSHRGITHTLFFIPWIIPFLIYGTRYLTDIKRFKRLEKIFQDSQISLTRSTWIIGTAGSYLHFAMDTINPQGTILFYPFSTERITFSTMSFFDPILTLLTGAFFFWYLYKKVYKGQAPAFKTIDRYTRTATVLFFVLLSSYAFMKMTTVNNYQPESSIPGFVSVQRWIIVDEGDTYKVELINQLTQQVDRTFMYQKVSWNQSLWSQADIEAVIMDAQQTREYRNFVFSTSPETRLVYNVTMDIEDNNWVVEVTDVFEDVQVINRGFESLPSFMSKIEIILPFEG